jgi:hypothetical protein
MHHIFGAITFVSVIVLVFMSLIALDRAPG